jgi:UDP-N-acetylmuramoylalanine--D-glutamate ligase
MIVPWSQSEWRRVLVYGLGASGIAAARLLLRRGVRVLGVDDRDPGELALGELAAEAAFEVRPATAGVEWSGLDGVVTSPGVPSDRPLLAAARARGLPVIAEVELAFALAEGPVVGITGSNGKSTTTAMTGALLRAGGLRVEICGNIGRPFADCVEGPAGRVFVIELSSFQLEGIATFRPRAAALLNLSPDHLDRHAGMAAYAAAKAALFERQEESDVAVLNADDPVVLEVARSLRRARRRYFSRRSPVDDGCFLAGEEVVEVAPGSEPLALFRTGDVPLPGTHNLENAMASALLARAFGVEPAAVAAGLGAFQGLPHRSQRVAVIAGVEWIDDSKGTNVGATAKSLEGFADGTVHLILGGRNKGADFGVLGDVVEHKARRVYLIGEATGELERALSSRAPTEAAGDLGRAVASASRRARAGEVVLLSPACASFDQYANFAERGLHFQRLVASLAEAGRG